MRLARASLGRTEMASTSPSSQFTEFHEEVAGCGTGGAARSSRSPRRRSRRAGPGAAWPPRPPCPPRAARRGRGCPATASGTGPFKSFGPSSALPSLKNVSRSRSAQDSGLVFTRTDIAGLASPFGCTLRATWKSVGSRRPCVIGCGGTPRRRATPARPKRPCTRSTTTSVADLHAPAGEGVRRGSSARAGRGITSSAPPRASSVQGVRSPRAGRARGTRRQHHVRIRGDSPFCASSSGSTR